MVWALWRSRCRACLRTSRNRMHVNLRMYYTCLRLTAGDCFPVARMSAMSPVCENTTRLTLSRLVLLDNTAHKNKKEAQAASEHRQPMDLFPSLSACIYPCHTHIPSLPLVILCARRRLQEAGSVRIWPSVTAPPSAPLTRYWSSSPVCQSR